MQRSWSWLLGLMLIAGQAIAWDTPRDDRDIYYWTMGGFGTTAQQWSKLGKAAGLEVAIQKSAHLFMFRWLQNNEADPGTVGNEKYELRRIPDEDINEIGLLYGRAVRNDVFVLSAAVGVSYIHGMRRGDQISRIVHQTFEGGSIIETYEERPFETVGLPVSLQGSAQALKVFGIVLELFGNANPERSYLGAMLGIQFGHLR
jgi:hypothetical protein